MPFDINRINQKGQVYYKCDCSTCNKQGWKAKQFIARLKYDIKRGRPNVSYCDLKCISKKKSEQRTLKCDCSHCGRQVVRTISQTIHKTRKSRRFFCDSSCAAKYNNSHKTTGTRVSKLQKWLWRKLYQLYPCLPFDFNKTDAINAELDIYCPTLKLAFELNGPFHYQPIYGNQKLKGIKQRDANKFLQCHKNEIGLCVIDTSKQKYVKQSTCLPFLKIITDIIDSKYKRQGQQKQIVRNIDDQINKSTCGVSQKPCDCCGKLFFPDKKKQKTCSKQCMGIKMRGENRPTKQQLIQDCKTLKRWQMANKYNASSDVVKGWMKEQRVSARKVRNEKTHD